MIFVINEVETYVNIVKTNNYNCNWYNTCTSHTISPGNILFYILHKGVIIFVVHLSQLWLNHIILCKCVLNISVLWVVCHYVIHLSDKLTYNLQGKLLYLGYIYRILPYVKQTFLVLSVKQQFLVNPVRQIFLVLSVIQTFFFTNLCQTNTFDNFW